MSMVKLATYFYQKYAANDKPDISFGVSITPERTRILKDKLILVYDKINKKITQLPQFQELNKELSGEFYLKVFNELIDDLVINIEHSTLKDGFSYATRMIDALNRLRHRISRRIERDKAIQLDLAIKNVQDTIWKEAKNVLNIHDLRGIALEYPELEGISDKPQGSWQFGPMKSNVNKPMKQRTNESVNQMIKRLQKELTEDEKK